MRLQSFITALILGLIPLSPTSFGQQPTNLRSPIDIGITSEANFAPLKVRTLTEISSATAKRGQPVPMEAVEPLVVDGQTVIVLGAHVSAIISEVHHRGHNHREGRVAITVTSVTSADGREQPLRRATVTQGTGKGAGVFGPCTFPFPADPVGLFRKGQDVVIPKGYTITVALPKAR